MNLSEDWDIKFAALLLCQARDRNADYIHCKEQVTVYCLDCKSYFCMEHFNYHWCKIEEDEIKNERKV